MKPSRMRPKIRRLVLIIGLTGAALAQGLPDSPPCLAPRSRRAQGKRMPRFPFHSSGQSRFSLASISFCISSQTCLACSWVMSMFSITERLNWMPLTAPLFSMKPSVRVRFRK